MRSDRVGAWERATCGGLRRLCGLGLMAIAVLAAPAGDASSDNEDAAFSGVMSRDAAALYAPRSAPGGGLDVTANFRDFNRESLSIRFRLDADASRQALTEFGVSNDELETLTQQCLARKDCDQTEFDRWTTRYYREHGLRLRRDPASGMRMYVDVPQVVQRNRARVKPVAAALRKLAQERGYDRAWTIEAAVAMVQTGLVYRQPKSTEFGRRILGFYPPPLALERGYGDCDTKSALLAAILQNLSDAPIIGVHVPKHYLLGVAATPQAGQATIEYGGKTYVLIEAAGPGARRPGAVAEQTELALASGQGIRVDPMF